MKKGGGKSKGHGYERKVCKILSSGWGGIPLVRTPLSGGWGRMKTKGDIVGPDEFRFFVECKNQEGWNFDGLLTGRQAQPNLWWEKCVEQAREEGKDPLLIFTRNFVLDYARFFSTSVWDSKRKLVDVFPKVFMADGSVVVIFDEKFFEIITSEDVFCVDGL